MKILITLLLALSSINPNCKEAFTIVNATSQEWHGGRPETGYGTYYKIELIPNFNSEKLKFDTLWIGDKSFKIEAIQIGRKVKPGIFDKGYNVSISVNKKVTPLSKSSNRSINKEEQEKNIKNINLPPYKYKGEALLSYTLKGKQKYFEIEKFDGIKAIYYP